MTQRLISSRSVTSTPFLATYGGFQLVMGVPPIAGGFLWTGNSHLEMDDNWGYPYDSGNLHIIRNGLYHAITISHDLGLIFPKNAVGIRGGFTVYWFGVTVQAPQAPQQSRHWAGSVLGDPNTNRSPTGSKEPFSCCLGYKTEAEATKKGDWTNKRGEESVEHGINWCLTYWVFWDIWSSNIEKFHRPTMGS